MKLQTKFICIILFIALLFTQQSIALTTINKVYVADRIVELTEDPSILPLDIIKEVDQFILLSKKNDWQVNLLTATTLKIEILVLLEQLSEAEELVKVFYPIALAHMDNEYIIRLELSKLTIDDAKGFSQQIIISQKKLLDTIENIDEPMHKGSIYLGVGQSQYAIDNLSEALVNFKKAYQIFFDLGDQIMLSDVQSSMASIYIDLGDAKSAIEFLQEAVEIKKSLNDELSLSILFYNMAEAYKSLNEYGNAIQVLEKSITISTRIKDDIGVMWAKVTLADIYLIQDKPELALKLYVESAELFKNSGDDIMQVQSLTGQAIANLQLKKIKETSDVLVKIKPLLSVVNSKLMTADYTKVVADFYYVKGEFKQAFKVQQQLTDQKDDIYQEEREQETQKFRVQFDAEIKENKNIILNKANELNNLKIAKQQKEEIYWKMIMILAGVVIVVITLLLYIQTKHRNRFKDMALKDHLTDSPNRRAILKFAEERYKEADYTDMELTVGIIDLDHFKKVNDSYGHDVGDEVLKSFAEACRLSFRKQDRFGRYGGEEWLLVSSDTNESNIQNMFDRLHHQFNDKKIKGIPQDKILSFSMGVARFNAQQDKSLKELINRADENLYKAKSLGRNQLVY